MIIHSDYLLDAGTLKIIKKQDEYVFTNPGNLKLSVEEIYKGGNSKSRNPSMQLMLRMVGFGDNAGSGIPTILSAWKQADWTSRQSQHRGGSTQIPAFRGMRETLVPSSIRQALPGSSRPVPSFLQSFLFILHR
jgi:predicted HTH transcriptional regulator